MKLRRGFDLKKGERVLVVEDVVTTGGSVDEVCALVKNSDAKLVGIGCIVDRSNGKAQFDAKFYSVMEMDVQTFAADAIPPSLAEVPISKPGSRGLQG